MSSRSLFMGERKSGYNLDPVDVEAGIALANKLGYTSPTENMVAEFALRRWERGEEEGAIGEFLHHGFSLTSARAIIAVAVSTGSEKMEREDDSSNK